MTCAEKKNVDAGTREDLSMFSFCDNIAIRRPCFPFFRHLLVGSSWNVKRKAAENEQSQRDEGGMPYPQSKAWMLQRL